MDKEKNKKQDVNERLTYLETKLTEWEEKENNYIGQLKDLHTHRIDQIIDEICNNSPRSGFNMSETKEICKFFFNMGIKFGQGETINMGYDKSHHRLLNS